MIYMECIIHTTYNALWYICDTYYTQCRIDDMLSMKSITTVWPPPKAAATPLLWTQAPKAPASYMAYAVCVVYCMS